MNGKKKNKAKKAKPKKDILRILLEAIYWAATDGGYFQCDEEELQLEDFPKVARTVDNCLLPKGKEYLAGLECAACFRTIDRLMEHLRANLGAEWAMHGIPDDLP